MSTPIQLTPQQREMLLKLAAQSGRPWEDVLDQALSSMERSSGPANGAPTETVQAALVRLGLLGCIADAPADLSTNPRHMAGFGGHGN